MSQMEAIQYSKFNELKSQYEELMQYCEITGKGPYLTANSTELDALKNENLKLSHRISILKQAIQDLSDSNMDSILTILTDTFRKAVNQSYPDLTNPPIIVSLVGSQIPFGDYQCNSALPICKLLKSQGIKASPKEIAELIVKNCPKCPLIEKVDIANAGFINIFLCRQYCNKILKEWLKNGITPPRLSERLKVVVDFSSPNIAKEMHVGHLRSTIIGDSICRLLEFLGHEVLRINHVGDWGTQFGMLIAHLQDKFPNFKTESPEISDLQTFYKESKKRFDEDEDFKKRAYACVVKLQAFDEDYYKAWQLICDVSRKEFQKLYDRLDIKIMERGESFYQSRMEMLVKELSNKNLLEEDNGRMIMWGEKHGEGIPLTIVKSDGGFTYDTSDLAAIKHRIEEEKANWLIYVTDAGQSTHFQSIESCAKRAGILNSSKHRLDHVGFGVVLGEDGKKFKTRSGDTVKLIDLLDEGLRKTDAVLKSKGRDTVLTPQQLKAAQESVAYGCIKYADLSHNRNLEYVFSFDKMLEDKGNTAAYMLYQYTRISSIARNANVIREQIIQAAENIDVSLEHPKEWKLGKVLLKFPDVLIKITHDLFLHHLCEYMYEVATSFSEFYDNCYCIEKNKAGEIVKVNMNRLMLCELTAMTLIKCFDILGLKPVSFM
ncbi:probable arginine--tRNA ligase, cytoplasmic isoform X2 [Ctenocephalides felis]|nr:probable arginine--tRNA ligase, cytoplasmic isoform X2 [Ctenocephalides felis]